jgi:predicted AAA+ superfamily ATPase
MVDDLARPAQVAAVRLALARGRVVLLAGPRQAGKTTIARRFVHPSSPGYFDLENPSTCAASTSR